VNRDGSLNLAVPTPDGTVNTRITQSSGTGGALNYENENIRLQADKNIIDCITGNLPIVMNALGARLPASGTSTQPSAPQACRDPSHGVERYQHEIDVSRESGWRGGGYDQGRWCNEVLLALRAEHPNGDFRVLGSSEQSESKCKPFNCPQYNYICRVHIRADPIYNLKISPACPTSLP
jgi:hypothetical protein